MSPEFVTLSWTCRLVGFTIALQSAEMLLLTGVTAQNGIWTWDLLQGDFQSFPPWLRRIFGVVLGDPGFVWLSVVRLTASLFMLASPSLSAVIVTLLTTLLTCMRWRGLFNGGSDKMTLVLLTSLTVGVGWSQSTGVVSACLWYIGVQVCLSYFVAGFVKLKSRDWRTGQALSFFVLQSNYETPRILRLIAESKPLARISSWLLMAFEIGFPGALLNPRSCLGLLALSFTFHFGNFFVFGLNRFVFAWACTYPALYYCSQSFWAHR